MILYRTHYSSHTSGRLILDSGLVLHTIEPPWSDAQGQTNVRNTTCIPEGTYELRKLLKSASGKYKNVFWVTGVKERSGILIHNGNTVKHTRGCIIVGLKSGTLAGEPAVLNSRSAMSQLWESCPPRLVVRREVAELSKAEVPPSSPTGSTWSRFINFWMGFFKRNKS